MNIEKFLHKKVNELLKDSFVESKNLIKIALNSGAIDLKNCDEEIIINLVPKVITTAILQKVSEKYNIKGSYNKKEIKNLKSLL